MTSGATTSAIAPASGPAAPAGAAGPSARRADPASAGRLIVTLYGMYARDGDPWLSTAAVVRLAGELGVDAPAVRSALSRLKGRGILASARRADGAGHLLSPPTEALVAEGDERIFTVYRPDAVEGWVLVAFSVPEVHRDQRHQLRVALGRLGFGTVASGLWIAPGHLAEPVRAELDRRGLAQYVEVFPSSRVDGDLRAKVAEWWDLSAIAASYTGFLDRFGDLRDSLATLSEDPAGAFAAYIPMLTGWRRLPYLDPGLPLEVLPPQWPGADAEALFHSVDATLRAPAGLHAARLVAGSAAERIE